MGKEKKNETVESVDTQAENVNEAKETKEVKEEVNEESGVVISGDDNGIIISEEVIASIASIAAQEVKGVAAMTANGIGEVLGRKTKGVKVQSGDKDVIIDITLTIEYGARIPDIAWEVQNRVKTQVETQTGLNVAAVNVHVQGISVPKKKTEPSPVTTTEAAEEKEEPIKE